MDDLLTDTADFATLSRRLPYLVGNLVELLELDIEKEAAEEGANIDLDAIRVGKSAVIKTSTRQTIFLPLIGLVDRTTLKPNDLDRSQQRFLPCPGHPACKTIAKSKPWRLTRSQRKSIPTSEVVTSRSRNLSKLSFSP